MKTRDHDCPDTWRRSLEARRGEVSKLEELRLEEEMTRCEHCARIIDRVTSALSLTKKEEPEVWIGAPLDADALFARIEDELEGDQAPPQEGDQDQRHDQAQGAQRAGAPWLWIAVAASLLLGLGVGLLWGNLQREPAPAPAPNLASAPQPRDDAWSRQDQTPPSVSLYARSDARWTLSGQADHTLQVHRGELLVDFTPLGEDSLALQVGELRARVVGTVVYIQAEDPENPRLGVVTGAVEVLPAQGGQPVLLRDGQSTDGALPPEVTREADALIDLERHRQLVDRLRQDRPAPEPPSAAPDVEPPSAAPDVEPPSAAPDVEPVEVTQRQARRQAQRRVPSRAARARRRAGAAGAKEAAPRVQAEEAPSVTQAAKEPRAQAEEAKPSPPVDVPTQARRALGRRDYREAARLHELWLGTLPTHSGQAATVRLELTRLYLRRLNRRADAVKHLRGLLRDNSGDPIVVEARAQLCELLGARAQSDPACR